MTWIYYLLEANLYLFLFFAFYILLLRSETFYNRNRFYLITSSFLAFIIPLIQLGFLRPEQKITQVTDVASFDPIDQPLTITQPQVVENPITFNDFILPIYLVIALFLLIKLIIGVTKILKIYRNANTYLHGRTRVVELSDNQTAFSFMNLLFINPALSQKELIFNHELIHIEQKHTWDVLWFEVIQAINWFNPLIHLIKKEVKVLHEYIADEMATHSLQTKHEYAMVLIENSLQFKSYPLANQFFNQSILKRRILMLNKEKTKGWARLKLLMALPLAGGLLCASTMAFTDKDYGFVDLLPEKATPQKNQTSSVDSISNKVPQNYFYPKNEYSMVTKKATKIDSRLIVINGKFVENNADFNGVENAKTVKVYSSEKAIKLYGKKAKNGAVVITGENMKVLGLPEPPPTENYTVNRKNHENLVIKNISEEKTLTVYNKWGKVIYNSTNYQNDWDGNTGNFEDFNGEKVDKGSYYYLVRVPSDKTKSMRGYILFTNGEGEFEKKSALKPTNEVYHASADTDTKNKLEELTVIGVPSEKVRGIQIEARNNYDLKEFAIEGVPLKIVQGLPMNQISGAGKINEIIVDGKPIKKVQGVPLNGSGNIQKLEIIPKKQKQPDVIDGDPTPNEKNDQAKLINKSVKGAIVKEIAIARAEKSNKN